MQVRNEARSVEYTNYEFFGMSSAYRKILYSNIGFDPLLYRVIKYIMITILLYFTE